MADLNFLAKSGESSALGARTRVSLLSLSSLVSTGAIIFTLGSFVAMGGLFLYYRYQTQYLTDLNTQKRALENDLRPELVNRLVSVDTLLGKTRQLLQAHAWTSNVFQFLESTTHANVSIGALQLSTAARKLDIDVVVPSYLAFSEQIKIFENSPLIERVMFGSPASVERGTSFRVSIIFKPAIFQRAR